MEVAAANQVERRNSTSSSIARAGGQSTDRQSATRVPAAACTTSVPHFATKKKHRNSEKTIKTKNSTNCKRGSMTKPIERIASSIVEGRGDDLHTFMMMRKMEWDKAEERRRQEREEARCEREESRREREEMEDRCNHRQERQLKQQNQIMQMMMLIGGG